MFRSTCFFVYTRRTHQTIQNCDVPVRFIVQMLPNLPLVVWEGDKVSTRSPSAAQKGQLCLVEFSLV